MRAGHVGDAKVAADIFDDFVDRTGGDVVVEVGLVKPFEEFAVKALGFIFGFGSALNGVFDGANDALARGDSVVGFGLCGYRLVEFAGEHDGAADRAGDTVEGDAWVKGRGDGLDIVVGLRAKIASGLGRFGL